MLHTFACQKSGCLYLRTKPNVDQSLEVGTKCLSLYGNFYLFIYLFIFIFLLNIKWYNFNCFFFVYFVGSLAKIKSERGH